jgi:hypothetical protein
MKRAFIPILIGIVFALIVITETIAIANGATAGTVSGIAWLIALWAVGLFFYFLPAFIAWQRDHHALLAIFILNLLLGWTFLGWVAALVWSAMPIKQERRLIDLERELIQRSIDNQLSI